MRSLFVYLLLLHCQVLMGQEHTFAQLTKSNGVFYIPCKIVGEPVQGVFDTGASDVLITADLVGRLLMDSLIDDRDILGSQHLMIADGTVQEGWVVNLPHVELAGRMVLNVRATVTKAIGAPILIGNSVLSRLGPFTIDYNRDILVLGMEIPGGVVQAQHKDDDLVSRINGERYPWAVSESFIERTETLRRFEPSSPLVQREWKTVSPFDGSKSLNYISGLGSNLFKVTYGLDSAGLRNILLSPLARGLCDGNPEWECSVGIEPSRAFRLYVELDELCASLTSTDFLECTGNSYYECISNGIRDGSYLKYFTRDMTYAACTSDFEESIERLAQVRVDVMKQARYASKPMKEFTVVRRRINVAKGTSYDLCLTVQNDGLWRVWLNVKPAV